MSEVNRMRPADEARRASLRDPASTRLLMILAVMLPLALLLTIPDGGLVVGAAFWLFAVAASAGLWVVLGLPWGRLPAADRRLMLTAELPEAIRDVMEVRLATEETGVRVFRGRLREPAPAVYEKLASRFAGRAVPMLQEDETMGAAILLTSPVSDGKAAERSAGPWVHWLLLGLAMLTTTWAGAAHAGIDLLREPLRFAVGLPHSLGLLAILGAHELGHFIAARRHGMSMTAPYLIPVPFALGTFGAFAEMRQPAQTRRALFDVAVAGPLAGLAIAVPALLVGLPSSSVIVGGPPPGVAGVVGGSSVGSSLLLALLSKLALGDSIEYGHILQLSPLAFAGWLGLLVTALNLLPIGQLDGGHVASALFGRRRAQSVSSAALWSLLLLAVVVWPGLLMWALVAFFLAGRCAQPLDDITGLDRTRRWLGYLTSGLVVLTLAPLPHWLWTAAGIHCPYV